MSAQVGGDDMRQPIAAEIGCQRIELHTVPARAVQQNDDFVSCGIAFVQSVRQLCAVASGVRLQVGEGLVGNGR